MFSYTSLVHRPSAASIYLGGTSSLSCPMKLTKDKLLRQCAWVKTSSKGSGCNKRQSRSVFRGLGSGKCIRISCEQVIYFLKDQANEGNQISFNSISSGKSQSVNPIGKKIGTVCGHWGQINQNKSYFELLYASYGLWPHLSRSFVLSCFLHLCIFHCTVAKERDCSQSRTKRTVKWIATLW